MVGTTVTHKTIGSIRAAMKTIHSSRKSLGFVPTMGALHKGHISLLEAARKENDHVVASIFVNPTQFGPNEDLDKYPRQMESDLKILNDMGVSDVFAPSSVDVMYGSKYCTYIDPVGFDDTHEGRSRPGHFRGVATIVTKLFNLIQPTNAYFGQKDAAQCVLIKRIVEDLNMPVNVRIMDTVREKDGLAMSSRNAYLNKEERAAAPVVFKSLTAAAELYKQCKSDSTPLSSIKIQELVRSTLEANPLVNEIQYIAVTDTDTFGPLETLDDSGAVVSLALRIGNVRLIDNIVLR